jgi:hypothetical protein
MTVIKESHESIMKRKNLEKEKHRILNMDFKKRSDRADWENLNKYLQERQSNNASNVPSGASISNQKTPSAQVEENFTLPQDN